MKQIDKEVKQELIINLVAEIFVLINKDMENYNKQGLTYMEIVQVLEQVRKEFGQIGNPTEKQQMIIKVVRELENEAVWDCRHILINDYVEKFVTDRDCLELWKEYPPEFTEQIRSNNYK